MIIILTRIFIIGLQEVLNKKIIKFSALLVLLLTVTIYLSFYIHNNIQNQSYSKKNENFDALITATKRISAIWAAGDSDKKWENSELNCSSYMGTFTPKKQRRSRCNPEYLKCRLILEPITIIYKDQKYQITSQNFNLVAKSISKIPSDPIFGVKIDLFSDKFPDEQISITLQDGCNDVFLPENIYGKGIYTGKKGEQNWQWDSFNRYIYIDKFLATNYDLATWAKMSGKQQILSKIKSDEVSRWEAAATLTKEEMIEYCAYRGKQVMTQEIFDAVFFSPMSTKKSKIIYRSPHKSNNKQTTISFLNDYSWNGVFELFGRDHNQSTFRCIKYGNKNEN